jgi:hypothetical protein
MNHFYSFLRNPVSFPEYSRPELSQFLKLFFFYLISIIPLALLAYFICSVFGVVHQKIEFGFLLKFFLIFLLAPIYEEIFFRSLLKFNWFTITIFLINLSLFLGFSIIKEKANIFIFVSICLLVTVALLTLFSVQSISNFISARFKYFFFLTSIVFGILHGINFTGSLWVIIPFSFILGGPQIVLGLILGYIRIKYGLIYCILFHMMVNFSVLLS